ncbi:MAG: bifunctional 4-hydroxy-2-oxoglutarate aldolase/2-dehydro-3-deoxy-phosphogluconate aldolase [Candidatus Krumholzibacteria bacterium]|nr:bifunctional 4-hydroxy-2-oxoglutarate aldolase/2-dehydro-3-deoxy-phosphogluconate aldolase [Candidatus Krumholzibacteria bacterium]
MTEDQTITQIYDELLAEGVVLCVRLGADVSVVDACRAAVRGGVRVLEVTLTTPCAIEAIAALANDSEAIVGGGTVLTPADAQAVAEAGGRFAFSPVFQPEVVDAAHQLGLLAIPGAASATEILAAHKHGVRMVKIFPAGALGGPSFVRAVRGPLPDVPLVPTSGPDASNLAEYFAAGAVVVGVGSAEVLPPGFTPEIVEAAARRVRAAVDKARNE